MAAAASTVYLIKGRNRVVVDVRGIWDTADETDTVIIDKSTLTGPSGIEPGSICVEEVTWTITSGFDYIKLEWDHTTDDVLEFFHFQGYMDYRPYGGKNDPESSGDTGDLILTSSGGASGDSYSFLISARLKS